MRETPAIGEALCDEDEMARLLGCSVRFLQEDRRTRRIGIPVLRLGRLCRYQPRKVLDFVEAHSAQAA